MQNIYLASSQSGDGESGSAKFQALPNQALPSPVGEIKIDLANGAVVGSWPAFLIRYFSPICVSAVALLFSLRHLPPMQNATLEGDTRGYQLIARAMKNPIDTDMREPIWIWATWLFDHAFGGSDMALRFGGMFVFIAATIFTCLLAETLTKSRAVGLLSGLLMASNDFVIDIGLNESRDIMILCGFAALSYYVFRTDLPRQSWLQTAAIAFCSAAVIGTRLSNVLGVFYLLGIAVLKKTLPLKRAWIPLALTALIIVPYIGYCSKKFNDPFFASNIHAKWFRNYEFCYVKKTGCPECPPCSDYMNDKGEVFSPYVGPPVTATHWVFGMRPFSEFWRMFSDGIVIILFSEGDYFRQLSGMKYNDVKWLYLAGLLFLILGTGRTALLVPFFAINLVFFTANWMPARIFSALPPYFDMAIATGAALVISVPIALLGTVFPRIKAYQPLPLIPWSKKPDSRNGSL